MKVPEGLVPDEASLPGLQTDIFTLAFPFRESERALVSLPLFIRISALSD